LIGQAAVAAAGVGIAALAPAKPARAAGAAVNDQRPRLPMRLLVKGPLEDEVVHQLEQISPQITVIRGDDRYTAELPAADVVYGPITPPESASAKRLRWIQAASVGVDHILSPELVAGDVLLTNTRGCSSSVIAEHVFALMLALTRGVGMAARERKWVGMEERRIELRGSTMGIIGLGGIGREVARRAKVMDMHVIAVDAEPMFRERYQMADEVWLVDTHYDEMLRRSDVVVCCAPLTARTRGMLGAREFDLFKPQAVLIHVSRGPLVKTNDLLAAIRSKKLAGAGLDVTDPEPLPNDHPLWQEPNVIITPHKAGRSQFVLKRQGEVLVENVRRYVAGLPMLNVVDKQKGY
jgi:phosphoglycerate dehydrogenase-like enzyme